MLLHGTILADPGFVKTHGNHLLNAAIGLLSIGCQVGRTDWTTLAVSRIDDYLRTAIDAQGVPDEGSVWYDAYVYVRVQRAREALVACGLTPGPDFDRVAALPDFLAQATQPDGRYTMLGDTLDLPAVDIPGTTAEFAATRGAAGPMPDRTAAVYDSGYLFARTGWGTTTPMTDETALSLRFGTQGGGHGHQDGASLTLYGFGSRLLVDPGMWAYQPHDPERAWATSRGAHDTLVVDGATPVTGSAGAVRLLRSTIGPHVVAAELAEPVYAGVEMRRRVLFSRAMGYAVVEDRAHRAGASGKRTAISVRQLWHLREGSRPTTDGARTWTRRDRGNVLIWQLTSGGPTRVVTGQHHPLQGWIGNDYRRFVPAPVVEQLAAGRSVRLITLLVPFASGHPAVSVHHFVVTSDGFSMVVTVDGRRERVSAGPDVSRIEPLP